MAERAGIEHEDAAEEGRADAGVRVAVHREHRPPLHGVAREDSAQRAAARVDRLRRTPGFDRSSASTEFTALVPMPAGPQWTSHRKRAAGVRAVGGGRRVGGAEQPLVARGDLGLRVRVRGPHCRRLRRPRCCRPNRRRSPGARRSARPCALRAPATGSAPLAFEKSAGGSWLPGTKYTGLPKATSARSARAARASYSRRTVGCAAATASIGLVVRSPVQTTASMSSSHAPTVRRNSVIASTAS